MTMSSLHARRLIATGFLFAAAGMLACEGDAPTSPDGLQSRAAKGGGGGDPTVISALPADGEQGDLGLQIHVFGTGFEKGAKVAFHLDFKTDPDPDPGMTVQSTKFVSSTELIATTDIALDAVVSSRDISVSFRGRRGIGTETFHVKVNSAPPPEILVDLTFDDSQAGLRSDVGRLYRHGEEFVRSSIRADNYEFDAVGHKKRDLPIRSVRVTITDWQSGSPGAILWNANADAHFATKDALIRDMGVGTMIDERINMGWRGSDGRDYQLRFGRDCSEGVGVNLEPAKHLVQITHPTASTWIITGDRAIFCSQNGRGKITRDVLSDEVSAPFVMTLTEP